MTGVTPYNTTGIPDGSIPLPIIDDFFELAEDWDEYMGEALAYAMERHNERLQASASQHSRWNILASLLSSRVKGDDIVYSASAERDKLEELEYGTASTAPAPFLRPFSHRTKGDINKDMMTYLAELMK